MIDASAVARVLGIETEFRDLRAGGVLYLPQRIALFAQGATASSFGTTKFLAESAAAVGAKLGFGSPAHLAVRELLPPGGDGVGTIPVTVYPLADAVGSAAATGSIIPVGAPTKAVVKRVKINNIRSSPFLIPVGASVSHMIGQMLQAISSVLEMPVVATATYGVAASAPATNVGNGTLTALTISGAPRPGAYRLEATAAVVNGGVFRLVDPDGSVIATGITMTPAPGGTTVVTIAGLTFTLTDGATDFAVGDAFTITVPATALVLTSKWKGDSANGIRVTVEGDANGTTFGITQMAGGALNPSLAPALAQMGTAWETLALNALNLTDTAALDAISAAGEARWNELIRRFFVSFVGSTASEVVDIIAITNARPTDRVNSVLTSPGSDDLPFVVAARQLARIARLANNNPPHDYGSQRATGLTPGADNVQWDHAKRDQAVKAGCSTVEVKDGVVCLSDIVTMYHPVGEDPPGFRFVVDLIRLQNVVYNVALSFNTTEWDGAPLIPDNQPTVNRTARKPKAAVAEANAIIDRLGLEAILSAPEESKKKTRGSINSQNPKRLDLELVVYLSGNTNVKGIRLGFGFYFGTQAAA